MMRKWAPAVFVALSAAFVVSTASAAVQSKCLVKKSKCAATKLASLLKCEELAESPGKPADPNAGGCRDRAKSKFDGGADAAQGCFRKLEDKPGNDCITRNDTAAVEALVDLCVADVVTAIDPTPIDQTKCGVGKKKCVAKKLSGLLKCFQKAQAPGKPMDPNTGGCLDKVRSKFDGGGAPEDGCVAKLEAKAGNDCKPPMGNQAALGTLAESCVGALVNKLQTPIPTTTSTSVPTTTSTSRTTTSSTVVSTTSTSRPSTTTSSTSSTTSTTIGTGATCSANGLDVTFGIDYPEGLLGGISAIKLSINYPGAISYPGSGSTTSRTRVTNLAGGGSTIFPLDRDTNADAVDDRLDVTARASVTGSIRPSNVYRARFDCPAGTHVSPSNLSCLHSEAAGLDTLPFPSQLDSQIACSLSLAAAP